MAIGRVGPRVQVSFDDDVSRTHQSFKDSTDINTIMEKFRTTGFINHVDLNRAVYEDFSTTEDYFQSHLAIKKADAIFASLPARIRARVANDPAQLIDFVADPANDEELIELGLKHPILEEGETAPDRAPFDPPSSAPKDPVGAGGTGEEPGDCP